MENTKVKHFKYIILIISMGLLWAISGCKSSSDPEQEQKNKIEKTNTSVNTNQLEKDDTTPEKESNNLEKNKDEQNKDISNKSIPEIGIHPLLFRDTLVGGYMDGGWVESSEIYTTLSGEEVYKLYNFNGLVDEGVGSKAVVDEYVEGFINVQVNHKKDIRDDVGISCSWDAMPRLPIIQSNESQVYQKIVKKMLHENGLSQDVPIIIKQNIKVDLDGDNVDEVIIMAKNAGPGYLELNDYAVLFVRQLIDGVVHTHYLVKDIVVEGSELIDGISMTYKIRGILDTNGDGNMEILVEMVYMDSISYFLYRIKDGTNQILIDAGLS